MMTKRTPCSVAPARALRVQGVGHSYRSASNGSVFARAGPGYVSAITVTSTMAASATAIVAGSDELSPKN